MCQVIINLHSDLVVEHWDRAKGLVIQRNDLLRSVLDTAILYVSRPVVVILQGPHLLVVLSSPIGSEMDLYLCSRFSFEESVQCVCQIHIW